ncbi:MAG: hypothetical protein IJP67_00335 [Oscillospiraceae bacterium]|nr:hypothetical protein [Oscillospiraceae bacterium]
MKKLTKILALSLAVVMLSLSLASCGGAPKLQKAYTGGSSYYIDAIGWYASQTYTLKLNSDSTYELTYQNHIFGTTDPGIKGLRTVVYTGKFTEAAASDGWETHKDITLEPATRIYFEQHEKGFGRSTIAGHTVLDTANWTADMTSVADPENNSMDAKAFLSKFAEKLVITVEDPSLDAEDTSLGYRITTLPDLALVSYAG